MTPQPDTTTLLSLPPVAALRQSSELGTGPSAATVESTPGRFKKAFAEVKTPSGTLASGGIAGGGAPTSREIVLHIGVESRAVTAGTAQPKITIVTGAQNLLKLKDPFGVALDQIERFRTLTPDWDSYGADPISSKAVRGARKFVRALKSGAGITPAQLRPYFVAPIADGGIQMEWQGRSGALEVEIDAQGRYSYVRRSGPSESPQYDEAEDVTIAELFRALKSIL